MSKCPYTSECVAKDLDCYFVKRDDCTLATMVLDMRQQRAEERERLIASQLEETKLQIELGGI